MVKVDVEKIASLAYLELSETQKTVFQSQFENILKYVSQLDEVAMTPEEAKQMGAYHVLLPFFELLKIDPATNLRDENDDSEVKTLVLTNEEALSNAPKTGGLPGALLYEVPSIIER
ncbi:MAG: Asp-tRNA(Asn)/Glu-tRNA(Gln) amidotransferase GatCAB subunit [Bacteriovoracaceae bacterium]|nr:Asp-tRNA(Asn)/Glu-tRNA(Gln) amidotransferase GatCAB subunit [Bacteriovoracaceae bacterium]